MKPNDAVSTMGFAAAVLAAAVAAGYVVYRSQRATPGTAVNARAVERTRTHITLWPEPSRLQAEYMMERYGPPHRLGARSLAWRSPAPFKRIAVHRDPVGSNLEYVVAYACTLGAAQQVRAMGHGIGIDLVRQELSARSGEEALNFLALNLADEVAGGKLTPEQARNVYLRTARLAASGKTSPYLEGLLFKPWRPSVPRWETGVAAPY